MLTMNKNMNFDGTSHVTFDNEVTNVMTMNAYYNTEGNLTFGKTVQNVGLYIANKSTVDDDYAEFENTVYAIVGSAESTADIATIE